MTRDEAIEELKEDIALYMPTEWIEEIDRDTPDGRLITALEMAIQALEQTSALDKARAEIAAYGSLWVEYCIPGHTDHDIEVIVENVLKQAKEQVLAVIDKYREESEDKA